MQQNSSPVDDHPTDNCDRIRIRRGIERLGVVKALHEKWMHIGSTIFAIFVRIGQIL